jgi:hypothetical protein
VTVSSKNRCSVCAEGGSSLHKKNLAAWTVSIPNPQKFLPLANVPLEAQALGHAKGRDQAPLDLLAALSGVIAI